jgi:hypothetical protein
MFIYLMLYLKPWALKVFNNGQHGGIQLQNDSGKQMVAPVCLLSHVCWVTASSGFTYVCGCR